MEIRICEKCGATIEILRDCTCENCGIRCCGEQTKKVVPNSVDASFEKHVPVVEVVGNYIEVVVNHVMEDDHYIEWVALDCERISAKKYFKAGEISKAIFPYIKGSKVYAYCNKHGLWEAEVK